MPDDGSVQSMSFAANLHFEFGDSSLQAEQLLL
jgi:hypothetical protein